MGVRAVFVDWMTDLAINHAGVDEEGILTNSGFAPKKVLQFYYWIQLTSTERR